MIAAADGTLYTTSALTGQIVTVSPDRSTVTELGIGSEEEAARAASLVVGVPESRSESDGPILRITSQDAAKVLIEVLRTLDANGITPTTLSVRQPSLDDVFLALTGKHVEEEPPADRREMAKAGAR